MLLFRLIYRHRVHFDTGVFIRCRPYEPIIGRLPDFINATSKTGSSNGLSIFAMTVINTK